MNCEKVIAKLREKFLDTSPPRWSNPAGYNNRVIMFWYDANRDFEDCLEGLELTGHNGEPVKVLKHTSFLLTKHLLEIEDITSNYLVYLPVAYPSRPEENWLLDIESYSSRFYADALAFGMEECQISHTDYFIRNLTKHSSFFSSQQRKKKFVSMYTSYAHSDDEHQELRKILHCMIASTLSVSHAELGNVLLKLFDGGREESENNGWKKLVSMGLIEAFWKRCEQDLGYSGEQELLGIWKALFYTTFAYESSQDAQWFGDDAQYIIPNKGTLSQKIIQGRISDQRTQEIYKNLIISSHDFLQWELYRSKITQDPNNTVSLTLHSDVDKVVLGHIQQSILSGEFDVSLLRDIIAKRRQSSLWYQEYVSAYNAFLMYLLFDEKKTLGNNKLSSLGNAGDLWNAYADSFYEIDQLYRKWLYYIDTSNYQDAYKELSQQVDREYNQRVKQLNEVWNKMLEHQGILDDWKLDAIPSQQHFREKTVVPSVAQGSSYSKIFVIISDGMRYEVAQQLMHELKEDARGEATLDNMLGIVPSYTQLGMTSLLPHGQLGFHTKDDVLQKTVTSDRKTITGIEGKNKLLQEYHPQSIALDWETFAKKPNQEQRDILKDKQVVYLYYDKIDNTGEYSEHDVPVASHESIQDLKSIISRVGNHLNYTQVLITSDHGFLYTRGDLEATDKATRTVGDDVEFDGKRFGLSTSKVSDTDMNVSLSYLGMNDLNCFSPRVDLRYKKQGKVPQYVHGGVTLQEVCIPLIRYIHKKSGAVKNDLYEMYTKIHIVTIPKMITTNSFKLTIMQDELKQEKMKAGIYKIYLRNEITQKKVTNEVTITADSISSDAEQRLRKESFSLINDPKEKYNTSEIYSIVIEPSSSKMGNIQTMEIKLNIGIRNDFL